MNTKFGLNPEEYNILYQLVFLPLYQNKARVFVFGSRATGKHQKFSDIDLLYENSKAHPVPGFILAKIREDIENSHFPYKVDLVNKDELAQSYRDHVLKEIIEINFA